MSCRLLGLASLLTLAITGRMAEAVPITQSMDFNITQGSSVACYDPATIVHHEASYYRVFDLSAQGPVAAVWGVILGIEKAIGAGGRQPLTINVYELDGTFTLGHLRLVGSNSYLTWDRQLSLDGYYMYELAVVDTSKPTVIEVLVPDGTSQGNQLFVGANSNGESAPTYFRAPDCGTVEPVTMAAIGFPTMHMVMEIEAGPYGVDIDGDGIANAADNCPGLANQTQADLDSDGIGDACDPRNDLDLDGDGRLNGVDNCPLVANPGQADADGDSIGDACDSNDNDDLDDDGIGNAVDNCPFTANPNQADADGDERGDACDDLNNGPDTDLDDDGVLNDIDNCPIDANPDQADGDSDGAGDACDATDTPPAAAMDGGGCNASRTGGSGVMLALGLALLVLPRRRTGPQKRSRRPNPVFDMLLISSIVLSACGVRAEMLEKNRWANLIRQEEVDVRVRWAHRALRADLSRSSRSPQAKTVRAGDCPASTRLSESWDRRSRGIDLRHC